MGGKIKSSKRLEGWKPRRIPKEGARKRQPHRREKEEKRVE